MNLREELLKEHSKAQKDKIVKWIGSDQKKFDQLFDLFLYDHYRVVQRASWPLSYCVQAHPEFIRKHFTQLVKNLLKPGLHDAVKRNTVRLMQDIAIPEKLHGEVMNACFGFVADPREKAAVKVFSMTILLHLCRLYPDIRHELKTIIDERWDQESPAFRARAKKVLKELA